MKARLVAALAVFCASACDARPAIRAERIKNELDVDPVGISADIRGHFERPRPAHQCELGARRGCFGTHGPSIPGANGKSITLYERCVLFPDGIQRWSNADCNTPLVVAFDASPIAFTRPEVDFPIGSASRTEWISEKTPWLALDRDGSGCIESARELFAGFDDLAALDANADGRIDARDPAFGHLLLWADRDQDKRCTPNEIAPLARAGIDHLDLSHETRASSGYGSYEGETSLLSNGARVVDVHLAVMP